MQSLKIDPGLEAFITSIKLGAHIRSRGGVGHDIGATEIYYC